MVNNIVNQAQAASQSMAVALVESASASINDILDKDYEKKLEQKSDAKRALESKSADSNSKEILSDLVNKLSASGMKLDPGSLNSRIRGNVKDEYDLMLKSDSESEDTVSVRSLADAIKAVAMFRKVDVPVLGVVENMSYFQCPHCSQNTEIFGHGGGRREAERLDVPFLGEVPLDPAIRASGDDGEPVVSAAIEGGQAGVFMEIAGRVLGSLAPAGAAPAAGVDSGIFARFRKVMGASDD